MNIEIKKSKKPIEYAKAINFLEERIDKMLKKKARQAPAAAVEPKKKTIVLKTNTTNLQNT